MSEDLDTSWIKTEEKIDSIENVYLREQCDVIDVYFIYLNSDNAIDKIVCEKEIPEDGIIDKERLLKIIQIKRNIDNKKYRLFDILSFQVDIEPNNIDIFNKNKDVAEISNECFKVLPIFDSIDCISSIFIFHDINSLYFIFKNVDKSSSLQSILKTGERKSHTKKVRISDAVTEAISSIHKNKTQSVKSHRNKGTRKRNRKIFF